MKITSLIHLLHEHMRALEEVNELYVVSVRMLFHAATFPEFVIKTARESPLSVCIPTAHTQSTVI